MNMPTIDVNNLTKTYRVYQKKEGLWQAIRGLGRREYKQVQAVRSISMQVQKGEFVAFLGPNGAGKTTTLKLLSGVITPTDGNATVLGHVPWKREDAYRRRFALVMGQKNQLWWDLPAQESFRLLQKIYRVPEDQFDNTHNELIDLLGVQKLLGQPVRELSLGERMKMELIAALLHRPEILFLDEPTIGLDVVAQHNIQKFLKHYQQERKITILLTSHYMADITALCPRVLLIHQGQLFHDGPLDRLASRLAPERHVRLELKQPVPPDTFEGLGRLDSLENCEVNLRVDPASLTRVLAQILERFDVRDLEVNDPPIDQLIGELFRQGSL